MGIIAWLILGLLAGDIASKLTDVGGQGLGGGGGGGGAILGGVLFGLLTGRDAMGLDIGSILVAIGGACVPIAILRAIAGNRARV